MADNNVYWATLEDKDFGEHVKGLVENQFSINNTDGFVRRVFKLVRAYYGETANSTSSTILRGGEQGELSLVYINQVRNLGQHLLSIIAGQKLAFEATPVNNDSTAVEAAEVTTGLLRNAVKDLRLDRIMRLAAEYALVTTEGYVRVDWDDFTGEEIGVDPEFGVPIRAGDCRAQAFSFFDVVRDESLRSWDSNKWIIVREYVNKWDLAAQFPDLQDDILEAVDPPSREWWFPFLTEVRFPSDNCDLVPLFTFYHERTPAVPDGRESKFLRTGKVLTSGPLSYARVPVYRIAPGDIIGCPRGYSPLLDVLGPSEAYNSLVSAALSNQLALAVQSVLLPRTSNVRASSIGPLNGVYYDPGPNGEKPEALQLTKTPQEVFQMFQYLSSAMETLAGVSPITRGQIPNRLSGQAMALLDSKTLEFAATLAESYQNLCNQVGKGVKEVYQSRVTSPRLARLVGNDNRHMLRSFIGSQLAQADLVNITTGNPFLATGAAQFELARFFVEQGMVRQPEMFFDVVNTGTTKSILSGPKAQMNLIRSENEALSRGEEVPVLATDHHILHIQEHAQVLASPEARSNPGLVSVTLPHLMEHITQLRTLPPDLLQALGQLPSMFNQQALAAQRGAADPGAPGIQEGGEAGGEESQDPTLPEPAQPPQEG